MPEEKTPDEKETIQEIREPVKRPRWLIPLVTIIVVIFILWYFSRSCAETKPNVGESPNTTMKIPHKHLNQIVVAVNSELEKV